MIKAIIVDDERNARFVLNRHLENLFPQDVSIIGQASKIDEAVELIKTSNPDLVFLDIRMHNGTGFDILQNLDNINFEVIFVTAYDQYALKAFECSAFGYLLKPVSSSDLKKLVQKVIDKKHPSTEYNDKRLKILVENYGDKDEVKKLVINHIKGFTVISIEDIIRLEGDRNYTHFIMKDTRRITSSKTLGDYEDLLSEFGFSRIHQSTLVNLRHVVGFLKEDGGLVEMSDGQKLKVSRYRKQAFIKRFL